MSGDAERSEAYAQVDRADLVARYRGPLIRYFARQGMRPQSACEDLAHDTFLRLFALKHAEGVRNPEAYLFQIAASVLNDQLRKALVRRSYASTVEQIYKPDDVGIHPQRVLEGRQALEQFEGALNELKPRTRDIFLLSRMEGLTYTQIAVRLAVSVRTVENSMARALAHLALRMRDR